MKLALSYTDYRARIYAGWMGKSLGGTIGARMENHKARMHVACTELWPETIMPRPVSIWFGNWSPRNHKKSPFT